MKSFKDPDSANARLARVEYESQKLLEAASIVLQSDDFPTAARAVFDIAKELTGAVSGYVALLSEDGSENELLFLDSGGLSCTVDESLPMPIRGLREVSYREKRPAYDNDFMDSQWVQFMPKGHVVMKNVMFGPLIIDNRAEGLIGLANKPEDFDEADARIVMALSNLVAIGLKKAKMRAELRDSQKELTETISELELYASLLRHDLSNDLQLIIGEIELAKMKADSNPELEGSLSSIMAASSRMMRLLRVFSRYDDAELNDVLAVSTNLVAETKKSYPDCRIQLNNMTKKTLIRTRGKSLLPFVFDNIIRNSIQHVGPDVEIEINVNVDNERVLIDFVDNGSGIDEDLVDSVFTKGGKKGVGLYLCRRIVESYDGKIALLTDDEYNRGTALRVDLPLLVDDEMESTSYH